MVIARRLPADILRLLATYAELARGNESSPPVLLRDVCARLNVRVRRDKSVSQGKAFLSWDRQTEIKPTILLPMKGHETWDRFCAAHELGHFFLIREHGWIPEDKKDYWKTEDLCDHFARILLLPNDYFPTRPDLRDALDVIKVCDQVARRALVPWNQVARRVSERTTAYVLVLERSSANAFKVSASTLPSRKGSFAQVSISSMPENLVRAIERAKKDHKVLYQRIGSDSFPSTKLGEALRQNGKRDVIARVSRYGDRINLAVGSN